MLPSLSKTSLAKALLFKDTPIYVQFYITARCNLTCKQCNIIYANSDVQECSLDQVQRIADNLSKLKVAIVLLTGGEPFIRDDLPQIIEAFTNRGIHVRMQTNGLATEERIQAAIASGGTDISISLDSLWPEEQDEINGGFRRSWYRALETMALFTKHLPRDKDKSFASLGCVLQRDNLPHIEDVIRFGTEIGWFTSLVPVHVTTYSKPMNFRTFDQSMRFQPPEFSRVDQVIERVRAMKDEGFLLYDSDQYLDDIKRFVRNEETTWRSRHDGVCDSPNLYFAILPNGDFAPCCDHRLSGHISTAAPDFPKTYRESAFRKNVREVTEACTGCMYGSYPEMTIAMRFWAATLQRMGNFMTKAPRKPWPITYESMVAIAERIRSEPRARLGEMPTPVGAL